MRLARKRVRKEREGPVRSVPFHNFARLARCIVSALAGCTVACEMAIGPSPSPTSADGCRSSTWYFLPFRSGTPVRCAGNITREMTWSNALRPLLPPGNIPGIECAARADGRECQWGQIFERPEPYQPLEGVVAADQRMFEACPHWRDDDGRDGCAMLGCYDAATICRPPRSAPALTVHPSWVFSVFSDESGHVDLSRNPDHSHLPIAWAVALAATLLVICLCCCVGWACVLRHSAQKVLGKVASSKLRIAYQMNMFRAKSSAQFASRGTGTSEAIPLPALIGRVPKLPAWDVKYVDRDSDDASDDESEASEA